ncbi:hypothetical protein [Trinickia fusca]|uniref:Uncharacterized protein n=1 Tax=Trinickia fusca TaxID=2419777 RepID=A0A494XF05_9BURK|nr:hypothetical protein [Trinickia fusca]RKP48261.1 hypothetical protein D7S89_13120 [Trinickia fusca]
MIVTATNTRDSVTYSASMVSKRKVIVMHRKVRKDSSDTEKLLSSSFPPIYRWHIISEAAVWRGKLGVLKCLAAPRLVVELALSARESGEDVGQSEFSELLKDILTNGNMSDLAGDDSLTERLRKQGFLVDSHTLRSLPFAKKVPALCLVPVDSRENLFGIDEDESSDAT